MGFLKVPLVSCAWSRVLEQKLHHQRTRAQALFYRGQALVGLGRLDEAEVTATEALKLVRAVAVAAPTPTPAASLSLSPSPSPLEDEIEQALRHIKAGRREQRQRRQKDKKKEEGAGGLFGAASPLAGAFA